MRFLLAGLALFTLTLLGAASGFCGWLAFPWEYRSTSQVLVELPAKQTSDSSASVPELLKSQRIAEAVYESPSLTPFHEQLGSSAAFAQRTRRSLTVERVATKDATQQMLKIHFRHTDPSLAQAAAGAYSEAVQSFLRSQSNQSRGQLIRPLSEAREKLQSTVERLEAEYDDFLKRLPNALSSDGAGEHSAAGKLEALSREREAVTAELEASEARLERLQQVVATDPRLAIQTFGNSDDDGEATPPGLEVTAERRAELMVERSERVQAFGENHPTIAAIDQELKKLDALMEEADNDEAQPVGDVSKLSAAEASESAQRLIDSLRTKCRAAKTRSLRLDKQIEMERAATVSHAAAEVRRQEYARELERNQTLLSQLNDRMAKVELVTEQDQPRLFLIAEASEPALERRFAAGFVVAGAFLGGCLGMAVALVVVLMMRPRTRRGAEPLVGQWGQST